MQLKKKMFYYRDSDILATVGHIFFVVHFRLWVLIKKTILFNQYISKYDENITTGISETESSTVFYSNVGEI